MIRQLLVALLVVELFVGSWLVSRRLLRRSPPEAAWSTLDPLTAEELRSAVASCESADNWRGLGEQYMAAGCFAESEQCHRVACELAPRNATFRRQWAFALERLGLLDEANEEYRRTMELPDGDANACRYFIGRNWLRREQPEKAAAEFAAGLSLLANRYELARLRLRAGDSAKGAEIWQGANLQEELLQANLLEYRFASERGDDRRAKAFAERVRYSPRKLQNPFDAEAQRLIKATQQLGSGRIWAKGRELLNSGRLNQARKLLEPAAELERSSGVLELLAELALQQRRPDEAIVLLRELQTRHGPFPRITAKIGDVYAAAGRTTEAREAWLQAAQLQAGVDLKGTHHKLADSLTAAGDEASAAFQRALGHYHVGRELLHFGYAPQAINYFAAAVKLDPKLTQAWFYLGESRWLSNHSDEAAAAYRACLELNPRHGRALEAIGERP